MATSAQVIDLTRKLRELECSFKDIATAAGYKSNYKRAVEKYLLVDPNPNRLDEFFAGLLKLYAGVRPTATPNAATPRLKVLYWNHGGTDHSMLPPDVERTAEAKVDFLLGRRIQKSKPDVIVVAELRSKKGRAAVEAYGYTHVQGSKVDDNEVAVFVREGLEHEFVHDGRRWITIKVNGMRVTGVHLHKDKEVRYPALQQHAPGALTEQWVVIGDFNRHPHTVFPAAQVFSASRTDHAAGHWSAAATFATIAIPELEPNPHPAIEAVFF